MLIDWLTIRIKLNEKLGPALHEKVMSCLGYTINTRADGSVITTKTRLDFDALRSDSQGLFWTISYDAESQAYLSVGASPSSLEFHGCNVFGAFDMEYCAKVLIRHASRALSAILPDWREWQCQRCDVTANYDMGNASQVKQALRLLLGTDAPRRRTNSDRKGGDSVYWNPTSDLRAGKAYHKGPQLRRLVRRNEADIPGALLDLADNLLRLELKLGARWFRRLEKPWHQLTGDELQREHETFFGALIGDGVEVKDMETLLKKLEQVAPTMGQALAAHRTWALIKSIGYTQTKESTPKATFMRHQALLKKAGLSAAELCSAEIIELKMRRLIIAEPVTSWDDIRKVA